MSTAVDYKKLNLEDRIQLVQDIWDSIAAEGPNPKIPLWQQEELDRRLAIAEQSTDALQSWDEVRREIDAELDRK